MVKIILIAVLVLGVIFFRGTKNIVEKRDITCKWQVVVAVCTTSDKKAATFPPWTEIFKEGIKF